MKDMAKKFRFRAVKIPAVRDAREVISRLIGGGRAALCPCETHKQATELGFDNGWLDEASGEEQKGSFEGAHVTKMRGRRRQ